MKYTKPEFDVTVYKFEDIITASGETPTTGNQITPDDPNGEDWWG